jgi:endonuclease
MTQNMEIVFQQIRQIVETKYASKLPTEDQIYTEADALRKVFAELYPLSDEEFESLKKRLPEHIIHSIGYADTLRSRDSEHQVGWYLQNDNDGYFWDRFRTYLNKKWSIPVVDRLHKTTDDIMDDLGDPKSDAPFQRRGLLLGDVQSGKTATYTAICNKAADSGYRVIIVLAGMMENLRIQTQERLDAEFVGLDSKYTLDKKADSAMRNKPVGVGLVPPFNVDRRITRFTSVSTDFKASVIKSNGLNLNDLKGTALFVVKKNKSVLNNLHAWLTKDEDVLNLPLLLIDDEADNASVNTSSDEHNPTAINAVINKILRSFKQATYLGITATPFANIFIDPDMDSDGAAKDLFPRHFLTLLPTPDHYIGADRIFGNGSEDNWTDRVDGEYSESLIPILNDEQDSFYYFKHKKDLANDLCDLPPSMKEAIRYFVIATAISDSRFDTKEHRSMMINVSRFTDVQNVTADMVQEYINQLSSDIENYHTLPSNQSIKIKSISRLFDTWEKYKLESVAGFSWEHLLKKFLCKAARRIEVRSVNQKNGAKSLDYYNYKNIGMRVIAVGGNSLSRGLTLEGLTASYFYRNTMMYDTLLQMGRWFGYRNNYDDLFKIWIGEDAIGWYSYITDAFNELKDELRTMARQNLTPEDFGLKVRQDPGALIVTARNKMRSGTAVTVPITVSGRMIETPRLWRDPKIISANNELCEDFIKIINTEAGVAREYDDNVHAYIWRHVPKKMIVDLVSQYKSHPWNLNFQAPALAAFINEEGLDYWDIAVPFGSVEDVYTMKISDTEELDFHGEARKVIKDSTVDKMLRVNERHVRVGAGGCSKIGLSPERISALRKQAGGKATDKTYLVADRDPIALLHLMYNTNTELQGYPKYIYAIGLGFPGGKEEKKAKYIVNAVDLRNYVDVEDIDDEDDDI